MDITPDDGLAPELPRNTSCYGFNVGLCKGSLVELTEYFGAAWSRRIYIRVQV